MTQHQRIKKYLADFGSITPMQAFRDLGITKLSTRIGEMERAGMVRTRHTMEDGRNRYGEKTRFAKYTLIEE